MADQPGRKADLDKDGIELADAGKAELDKDGITLEAEEAPSHAGIEAEPGEAPAEDKPRPRRKLIIMAASGAAGLVVLMIVVGLVLFSGTDETPTTAAKPVVQKKIAAFGTDGVVLDPFMVLYETNVPKKSGVLIAQVSLNVEPAAVRTIESRLFDIRRIIYRRLSATASVYSQTEIALMLSDDLDDFPVKEVAFLEYTTR